MSKPIPTINRYKADLREVDFLLFEQFRVEDVLGKAPFEAWSAAEVRQTLSEAYRWVTQVTGPLNVTGDIEGCKVVDGGVVTPTGFKDAWKKLYEAGWKQLGVAEEWGGTGAPRTLQVMVEEFLNGSNTAFNMYSGLAYGAAEVIEAFGTDEQRHFYCPRMFSGQWGGTMCLTEPHAGSDVGAARTRAKKNADGSYSITGTKIFISSGDHDLAENIIHLVLARVEGAPAGTKGLTLFIVPKHRSTPDGALAGSNDVTLGGIEHKMGINGSSTCILNFGESDGCIGWPVGGDAKLHQGMAQMFRLMNAARISTGLQGIAVASSAYLNAVEYAKQRKQGASIKSWKDATAPRVPIIEHPDVRRMLLDMKSRVEGLRALVVKLTMHQDRATGLSGKDDGAVAYHQGQIDLLVPLVKAYGSDQAFRVCETAIQTLGGVGYTRDFPVEQYCRDSKIFSIYEGTNHIQAMDLVGRKLGQNGGGNMRSFLGDVGKFVAEQSAHAKLGAAVKQLGEAQDALMGATMKLMGWFSAGKMEMVPLAANRFLEMMSEVAVGWLLLDGAVIAERKSAELADDHADRAFYAGKVAAALYFARNVLPTTVGKAQMMNLEDTSAMDIPEAGFATV